MTKKVFIGVLTALMLFAFTACDSQVPGYKVAVGITAETSKTEYLVGEIIDPSTIIATVEFSDGSTQTFTGAQLGVSAVAMDEGSEPVTVTYGASLSQGGDSSVSAPSATVTLMGYEAEKITIANLPTTAAWDTTSSKPVIDQSGITAVVEYNDGKVRELNSGDFEILYSALTAGTEDQVVTVTGVKIFGTEYTIATSGDTPVIDVVGDENWKVSAQRLQLQ